MGKIRVYKLAEELKLHTKDLVNYLKKEGVNIRNHMSTIDDETADLIREMVEAEKEEKAEEEALEPVEFDKLPTLRELSFKLKMKPVDLAILLIKRGDIDSLNGEIKYETLVDILKEFKKRPVLPEEVKKKAQKREELPLRPPVVTVIGHVDHGKTTLLDAIRNSRVAQSEAGGITQHIGAYEVKIDENRKIVFIDTPGHEAFTTMRARGVKATDIAVLVVAADDGVKPQTIEAINHAKAAKVPIIVAINKIDKPGVQINRVKEELSKQGIIPEEWGGEHTFVEISALQKKGIEDLLEMIALNAELLDLRADDKKPGIGIIIESKLDKTKGAGAKVLVKEGKIKTGDFFISGEVFGKVRTMIGGNNKPVKEAGPSSIVEIYGFSSLPEAGNYFYVIKDNKLAKELSEYFKELKKEEKKEEEKPTSLDELLKKIKEGESKKLSLIIKADVQGSLEAIEKSLKKLDIEDVEIEILHKGVGGISEADVMLASASKGIIVGFNVRPDNKAEKAAQREKVEIKLYRVIYELIEDIERVLKGLLEPVVREVTTGKAEVRQIFKIPKIGQVAGCFVLEGKIKRGSKARLIRDQVVQKDTVIVGLKRFKDDVSEVAAGYECGISLEGVKEYREGDIIEVYTEEIVK